MGGLIHIYTGDGKGKTTAAVGLALRASGAGKSIVMVQFLKGRDTSELGPLRRLGVRIVRSDVKKFIPDMTGRELDECKTQQNHCFDEAEREAEGCDLLILDEIMGAMSVGMIAPERVENLVRSRQGKTELVLTGRDAPEWLIGLADYVSDIRSVKHPYDRGVPARKGIEY
ncbi:MAG TPA: cob(I)yrinic acid a,c-diamide adenosyltransferase [Clostridia bacterium]|nr:cob(I)yrinic acid a,c-diamide adenosyltransferase [Clostridia bacterium]